MNGGRGHSNSRSLGGSFEIGGSGGIRGRRRLRGDTELQPRCYQASRRAQRRRFEGFGITRRPTAGSHVAGRLRARRARAEGGESDGVVAMSFVVQLRVCNASSKAKAAMRNAAWFQRRRIPRSRFYRIPIELSIDFYRNRFTSALRQCDAKFNCAFAMQVQRQKPSCATPDASVGKQASCGAQLERVVGRGRQRCRSVERWRRAIW